MKRIICTLAFLSCLLSTSAVTPEVSDVRFTQNILSRDVTITYILSAPAVVTADILTNALETAGVSIGAENLRGLAGDVNRLVPAGSRTITWKPRTEWPDIVIDTASVKARITAYAPELPPDFMVFDLEQGGALRYYASEEALPFGAVTNDAYKTRYLLMRRMDANGIAWTMGSLTDKRTNTTIEGAETAHTVVFTNDFYIGVYPVTQRQWELVMGDNPSWNTDPEARGSLPVEHVSYCQIRESAFDANTEDVAYQYPNAPHPDSFLGKLRTLAGGFAFDMPSEAQWEFAARAGHPDRYWGNGTIETEANLKALARFNRTQQVGTPTGARTAYVGSFAPNDFGLYDMNGNAFEWLLDWFIEDRTTMPDGDAHGAVNIIMDANNPGRACRGGRWTSGWQTCRTQRRWNMWATVIQGAHVRGPTFSDQGQSGDTIGFRLCAPGTAQ
ncbi:MAG: SUMF1/EgtB/PvdO family nonheme iron enzyme [Kiritimatiellae bacterium]|nr:SUMF1/EgtB/PvdO family nonheme iron enzyme [Kiritimatiellia bacterium]